MALYRFDRMPDPLTSCIPTFGVYPNSILSGGVNASSRYEFELFKKCRSQWSAWVSGQSVGGMAGSNPSGGLDVCLL